MSKDPAMPFYVNDWLSSPTVMCMTLNQQGAYLRLLCFCWASGDASITADENELALLSGMGEDWFASGSNLVRKCFEPHPNKPGYLTNKRLLEVWQERKRWVEKSAEAGRKSGESRRNRKQKQTIGDDAALENGAQMVRTKLEPNTNSSSSSSISSSLLEEAPSENVSTNQPTNTGQPANRSKCLRQLSINVDGIALPPSLDSPAFREALKTWFSHRREIRKPVTPTSTEHLLRDLEAIGSERAIAAIKHSIVHGWIGVFEDTKGTLHGNEHRPDAGNRSNRYVGPSANADTARLSRMRAPAAESSSGRELVATGSESG